MTTNDTAPPKALKAFVGIDPGMRGGISAITVFEDGSTKTSAWPMPTNDDGIDGHAVAKILCTIASCHQSVLVALELVGAMPGQGVTSMFSFGKGYGKLQGVMEAIGMAYRLVSPVRWKKALDLMNTGKEGTISFTMGLYPDLQLILPRCRTPHDGMADAVAIATWLKRDADSPPPVKPKPSRRRKPAPPPPTSGDTGHAAPHE